MIKLCVLQNALIKFNSGTFWTTFEFLTKNILLNQILFINEFTNIYRWIYIYIKGFS